MALQSVVVPPDRRFWETAARAVLEFGAPRASDSLDLTGIDWIVDAPHQIALARSGLRAAFGGRAFLPPRIGTLAQWLGQPLEGGLAAWAELFFALRDSGWVREVFGDQPGTLWALARGVARLCDELTWAAAVTQQSFAERLEAALARHYRWRAARALEPQAKLVLALWRARHGADDGAARAIRVAGQRADAAERPLVVLAGERGTAGSNGVPQAWWDAFAQRCAQRVDVLRIVVDLRPALRARPLLAAAWPELGVGDPAQPIADRADAVRADLQRLDASLPAIVGAASLEDEAAAVATQVLDWLQAGLQSIALVALDRLTARRVRALLERAQVTVRDETGWKLSTTSAAAAVMRWYDLVLDDLYWRDLLDWLKSGFTLAHRADKPGAVMAIERAIRTLGAVQGAAALRAALAAAAAGEGPPAAADAQRAAVDVLQQIEEHARRARAAGADLSAHVRALLDALDALGLRCALAADPVGARVLEQIEGLRQQVGTAAGRMTLAEFRALLAARLEETAYVERGVDSPVTMLSLGATALRPFDAAILIGADARHLPAVGEDTLFMSDAVRAELGLATAEAARREQAASLAALLAGTPRVVATWRLRHGDEPNAPSPLLARLQWVARRVVGDDLSRPFERESAQVAAAAGAPPAPRAPALLPARVAVSHAQSLVDCPYQFFARRMLGLSEPDDVLEMPDKRHFGEALHEVLRRFHARFGDADFIRQPAQALAAALREEAAQVFEALMRRAPGALALKCRFDGLVDGYVAWLRGHAAAGWRFHAAEEPLVLPLPLASDRAVELAGRIDRIDRGPDGTWLVIDYKARSADALKAGLRAAGEDVQLPLYGALLARRPLRAYYLSFERGREGETGLAPVDLPGDAEALAEAVRDRLREDLRRIGSGAALPAIGSAATCARCEMRGLCRRDFWERGAAAGEGVGAGARGPVDAGSAR